MALQSNLEYQAAPFGWYPDPTNHGTLRWWNGHHWTDHVEHIRPEVHPAEWREKESVTVAPQRRF